MSALLAVIRTAPSASPSSAPVPAATPELIRDVAPPIDYFPYPLWAVILVGVLAAALLLAIGYFVFIEWRRQPAVVPPRPRPIALGELERLRGQVRTLDPYAFSIAVSHVLRRYVEGQYRVPALEQTSPEFLAAIARDLAFSQGERKLLGDFLEECDGIKFARREADETINESLLARAFSFVQGGLS